MTVNVLAVSGRFLFSFLVLSSGVWCETLRRRADGSTKAEVQSRVNVRACLRSKRLIVFYCSGAQDPRFFRCQTVSGNWKRAALANPGNQQPHPPQTKKLKPDSLVGRTGAKANANTSTKTQTEHTEARSLQVNTMAYWFNKPTFPSLAVRMTDAQSPSDGCRDRATCTSSLFAMLDARDRASTPVLQLLHLSNCYNFS